MSSPRLEMGPILHNPPPNHIAIAVPVTQDMHSERLKPFLLWLHADGLRSHSHWLEITGASIGYGIGFMSTWSGYPLGSNFIELICGAASTATQVLKIPVALLSFIPTGVLLANVTRDEFKDLAGYLIKKPQLPTIQEKNMRRKISRALATLGAYLLAPFTGVPFLTLMQPYFAGIPFLYWFGPFTAIISSYCGTIRAERLFIENYFARTAQESEFIKNLRKTLDTRINLAEKTINKKSNLKEVNARYDAEIKNHYAEIISLSQENNRAAAAEKVLRKLLLDTDFTQRMNNIDAANPEDTDDNGETLPRTCAKTTLDISVIITAAVSTYIFYQLAIEAAQFGFNEYAVWLITAILAVASNAVFDVQYAKVDTDKAYAAYVNGQHCPTGQAVVAHLIACGSSIPNTYVAILQAQKASDDIQLALIPATTFIGASLARADAFSEMIDSWVSTIKKNDPRVIRANLNAILEKIRRAVWLLPAEILISLHETLLAPEIPAQAATARSIEVPRLNPASFFGKSPRSARLPMTREGTEAPKLQRRHSF